MIGLILPRACKRAQQKPGAVPAKPQRTLRGRQVAVKRLSQGSRSKSGGQQSVARASELKPPPITRGYGYWLPETV